MTGLDVWRLDITSDWLSQVHLQSAVKVTEPSNCVKNMAECFGFVLHFNSPPTGTIVYFDFSSETLCRVIELLSQDGGVLRI